MIMNTNTRKPFERLLAIALSFAMLFSLLPMTAFAESGTSAMGVSGEIIAFEPLTEAVAKQAVRLGTSLNKLNLPESLMATVRVATATDAAVPEPTEPAAEPDTSEPPKIEAPQITEKTITVPVAWVSEPEFDGKKVGAYIFTANVEGFTVSAALPTISVTVGKSIGTVTAFVELSDEIRWQNTVQPLFPETVSGAVYGKPTEIPVTWQADHTYNAASPARGLYVFDAVLGEGFTLAEDVEVPRITVYMPEAGFSLFRMGGSGTSEGPLEITTAAQLAEIAVLVNAGRLETFLLNDTNATVSLKLMNDLDLSAYGQSYNGGKGWVPIGFYNGMSAIPFKGSFDGGGHTISGLYINDSTRDFAGLFGITKSATLENLNLAAVSICARNCVGSIVGMAYGTGSITNCRVSGSVDGNSNLGGLIGTTSTMEATDYSMSHCSFEGTVSGLGSGSYIGGLIGDVKNCAVSDSYAAAAVSGNLYVGGLVGYFNCLPAIGVLQYCYAIGSVEGAKYVGGLAGVAQYGDVQNCAALNSAVEASVSDGGRVAGRLGNATLSGNAAFSGMTVKVNGSTKPAQDDASDVDGADMAAADIIADGSIATRFTDTDGWTIENGKLPGFGSAVDMPEYITDGSDPNFPGAGTVEKPYLIGTAEKLAKLAELVNAGTSPYAEAGVYYKLANDIDLSSYGSGWNSGKGWVPIGYDSDYPFKGNFDGACNIISGLYIETNDPYRPNVGLFGVIGDSSAVVENLGIIGASVSALNYIGGVAGLVKGGTVQNCYTTGSVSGELRVGGVVGYVDGGMVQNCYTTGSVSGGQYIGGVAGYVEDGTVQYCYTTGSVSGWILVGGVVGYVADSAVSSAGATVQLCFALNPMVSAANLVGRVAGSNADGTLTNNYAFSGMTGGGNSKTLTGLDGMDISAEGLQALGGFTTAPWTYQHGSLPGLFGKTVEMPAHITAKLTHFFMGGTGEQSAPYQIATPAQLAKLAELVNAGNVDYNSKYYKLISDIDLSGYGVSNTAFNGGKGWIPIGNDTGATFKGSFDGNYNTISGLYINNSLYYTGLFGLADGPIFNLGLTSVNITSTGTGGTGGIAGITQASGAVSGCFVAGEVSGVANVGGVVGNAGCSITNCYAVGSVKGTVTYIGGIAGDCAALSNCYAANAVIGSSLVGGIAGRTVGDIKNCAALNPSVAPDNAYVRRVAGSNTGAGRTLNNYAFSGMKGGGNDKALNNLDGADFSIAQANTAAFWTTAANWDGGAWSGTVWTFADGKLPVLTGFASGVQSGDGGLYLTERDIANATVDAGGLYLYTGSAIEPNLSVTFDGATLTKGTDYTVAVISSDNAEGTTSAGTSAGEVTIKLTGIGNFKGEKTGVTYTIKSSEIDKDKSTVTADPISVYIDGIDKSTVTITLKKANEESLGSGMLVTLSQGPGRSVITPVNGGVTDSTGKAIFTVTNTTAEAVTYTATADGITLSQTATVQFTQEECNFSGDGSQTAPYQIGAAVQLAKLAEQVNAGNANFNGKYYILMDDIDLSGYGESYTNLNGDKGWAPIGNYDRQFTGVFDGNGHTVSGLYANVTTMYSDNRKHAGLFGYLGTGGTVKNLGVSGNVNATGSSGTVNLAGGIAGYSEGGIISNCYSTCNVTTTGSGYNISGGIVGYNYNSGTVINCYAAGNISATTNNAWAGGLAGVINSAAVTYSYWNTDAIVQGVTQGTLGTGCEGKTSESMKTQAFTDALNDCPGFPSDWIKWAYSSSVNGGLPYIVRKESEPDTVISIAAIGGVTAPARGGTPVASITETAQYTGTVTWLPNNNPFAASTTYTATITLTPKTGFKLTGVAANFFTVAGATSVSNDINLGVITAVFPKTEAESPAPGECLLTYRGAQKRYNADTDTYDIRFIATIDTLNAKEVGFVFSKSVSTPTKENATVKATTTVYRSITAEGVTVTAVNLGGVYIVAYTITDIPISDIDVPLYVRAFSTVGTETKYTTAVEVTVNNLP